MADIQYAPLPPQAIPRHDPPEWLLALLRFLARLLEPVGRWLGQGWGAIETGLLVLAVLGVVWIAGSLLWPLWRARRRQTRLDPTLVVLNEGAIALLEDADRLAADGRFDEAAHLLLRRSVHHISSARPDWLAPSSTAREIAENRHLPAAARHAFASIAREVERSLFALRALTAEDWARARSAYAEFALADLKDAGA
ncbi:MAG: hypothetical protein RIS94_705 [Pseudomonadota bacterium]|jgi:hypothetical protein